MCFALLILGSGSLFGQVSGTKTIPTDYATLADFITDINTNGIGAGGVTLNIPSGHTETAPAGGFTITATGTVANPIVIQGTGGAPKPIITSSNTLVAGNLTDAVIKLIGSDYVTVAGLDLRENAANTATAAASNNMTEWGIALLYASATDGAQRNLISGNTITLNRTYTNTFGIYSNVRHTATVVGTVADITAPSGANSFNQVYSNIISNVNYGIVFNGSSVVANMDTGNDIGGSSAGTGNNISNYATAAAASNYINLTGSNYGIFVNHQLNNNISYNTLVSSTHAGTNTLGGILQNFSATTPSVATVVTLNNNTVTLAKSAASGTLAGVNYQGITTAVSGSSITMNNNSVVNCVISGTSSSSAMIGVTNLAAFQNITINGNTVSGNTSTATSGGFTGIANSGAVTGTLNIQNNFIGTASNPAITYSVATSGVLAGISNTTASAATATVNITGNDIRGFVQSVIGSGAHSYIDNGVAVLNLNVSNNTFTNLTAATTGNITFINHSYTVPSGGTQLFNNNSIVTAFNKTGAGGTVALTTTNGSSVSGTTATYTNNNFSNITLTGATTFSGFNNTDGTSATTVKTFTGNTINNLTGGTNAITCLNVAYMIGASSITGNTFTNITGQGSITGITIGSSLNLANPLNISNNTITGLSSTGSGGAVTGITSANTSPVVNINNNVIHGLSSTSGSLVSAIGVSGATLTNINANRIYNLSNSNAGGTVFGINITAGATVNTFNNLISGLTAPIGAGANIIRGININSTTSSATYGVYYNSVYLNASSTGTNFGTSGIFHAASATATTAALDMRNNIIVNESTANGTGFTVAFRRSSTSLNNYASTSNRNLLYAGVPSATRLVMYDGTTSYQTMTAYQTAVLPKDANSFTGEAAFTGAGYGTAGNFFISLTGSSSDFLRPVAGITTQVESGGVSVTSPSITTDFTGATRSGSPDMGAYEFTGVTPAPVITLNSVTPPTSTQCAAVARVISVNITTTSGTITGATIGYSINGAAQTNIVMTNVSGTTWEGTIPTPTPTNATIAWGVAAMNSIGITGNYIGTSYSDDPLLGVTASATSSIGTICSGSPTNLSAKLIKSGSQQIGNGVASNATNTAVGAFYGTWFGNGHAQILITAAEMTAAGFAQGNITALSVNVSALGSPTTLNGFTIKMAPTAATTITTFQAPTFTTVVNAANYTPVLGLNTHTFNTAFAWDGTSNIIVDYCYANSVTGSTSAVNTMTTTAFGSFVNYNADGATGAGACTNTSVSNASTNRPNIIFTGNISPAIQTISWSDGVTTVGTTNPLSVSPIATTTYTATITAAGCTVSPAPSVSVTVNPLPSAPTASNSAQCGVQIPTASVTSTSGLPTPLFNWYAASSGGSALQSGASTTYSSTVGVTTTFYVSELNTVTGCESTRVPVTINVSTPDQVSLTPSSAAICLGGSFTLTAANINPTPFQNYTYSTVGTTGSGVETPMAGASISVTPTAAGTYTYTLTATDGGCAASATATVLVNSLPAITSATATPGTVCSSDQITLTGASVSVSTGTTPIGTQTATDLGSGVYRYGFGTGDFRHQLVFTAAELNAAGLVAGNITSIAFNVTSVGSGSGNNYTIKMGNTSATAVTTTFLTDPTSTVYNTAAYTAVNGLNTHTFATPFNWNGTSNILIEICYNVAVTGGSSTLAVNTPASARNASLLGTASACTVATGTTFALRPIVTFGGQVGTNLASSLNWVWTPGTGLNTPIATTSITNTTGSAINQVFTVTATNPTTGCSSVATTSPVTINAAPATPVANNATQCGIGTPTISVTGSGTPGNTFSWYPTAVGGTAISGQTGSSLTAYPISATTTFYVSESNGTCSSARTAVTATVTTPPAITVSGTTTICNGGSTALTASSPNDPNYTYTWSGGLGTGATVNASPTANTTYTVTATDASGGANNGCVNTATYSITVNPIPSAVVAGVNDASICNGESVNLTSSATSNSQNVPATVLTQNFNSGLGAWTTTASGTAPATAGFVLQNPPYSYTTYFSNFSTPNGGGFAMSNADLTGSGNKIRTTLVSPSFSTVGMASANLTFENLYRKWNSGDSLARVEISTNGGTSWSALKDYMALGSQGVVTDNAQVPANESISLASYLNQANLKIRFNYVTTYGYYWAVDNIVVSGLQPAAATYSWASSPAGFTSSVQNPTGVAPTVSTTYTVTATNSYGCSASGSVAVTVNQPTSSTVPVTTCDTYTWPQNGVTYTTSGTHTAVIPNAAGCDSTITLNLTIKNSTSATVPVTACDTYTWPINGTTYTTSGTHTATIMNAAGCDSVITLNLTINHSTSATVNHVACQTYTWPVNGATYTTSGTYTATIMNAASCDSVITLNLTIGGPSASSVSATECSSYTWAQNGMTYTASGAYTDTIMNMYGCDSVITLNLTINQPTTNTVTETECTSYTWAQNGMTYTVSGMYNDTIANAAGCDSIITLDLTIIQPTTSSVSVSECSSYTWAQNGMTYTTSGMYTDTIPNGVGCDSIITLNLTINMPTSSVFTVSTCSPSYTWAQNGTVYNASGMYNDTIPNAAGCDSVVTLNLTITNFVATATDNGNATITASAGTTYQWVNCTTNTPIAGATAQTFAATANGSYAVIVSNGTCSDTSNCVNITNVGIKENTLSTISVHPNPTHDVVIVTMDASSAIVEVMDVQGKLVQTTQIKSGDQVDLSAYERGVYTLRIKTELGTSIERIVKN